ncbi:MAG: folylpolyglutamate synthase/dihydrofolate synthase family protein [Thermoplasmataceae archaeon]
MSLPNLEYLYGLNREGIKLDLSITRMFSDLLGSPDLDFGSLHIAGTNGKGSITSFIYNIFQQAVPSGMYTSPHLVKFNERILADDRFVSDDYINLFMKKHESEIENLKALGRNPTFFEVTTVMAFKYFSDKKVKMASVEVGLGGRLDSTNIIHPEVSIISNIGYDHSDKLGCSLTSIAYEKAGIIKEKVPVILLDDKNEVVRTVKSVAEKRGSRLIRVSKVTEISSVQVNDSGTRFSLKTPQDNYEIFTPLIGDFQIRNIATSVLAVENGSSITPNRNLIERGISQTRWPARMEIIRRDPTVMVDCAHNPPAAHALVTSFRKHVGKKPLLLVGMLEDKDVFSFLTTIRYLSDTIVITTPQDTPRALPAESLSKTARQIFPSVKVISDPKEAYEYARSASDYVLIAGSMYLVGFIKMLENSPVLPFERGEVMNEAEATT